MIRHLTPPSDYPRIVLSLASDRALAVTRNGNLPLMTIVQPDDTLSPRCFQSITDLAETVVAGNSDSERTQTIQNKI
jgi:hypothetical protein